MRLVFLLWQAVLCRAFKLALYGAALLWRNLW